MGKYIIHFDDKPWQDLDDEQYYRCKEIPWFSTTKTTISRLTPYTEDAAYAHGYTEAEAKYREIRDELEKQAHQRGYEAGLNDKKEGKATCQYCEYEYLDETEEPCKKCCKAYMNKYKPKAKKEQIQIGDEVKNTQTDARFIVTHMWVNNHGEKGVSGFNYECSAFSTALDLVRKTGRHFPEIAEVLEKMRGEQDG